MVNIRSANEIILSLIDFLRVKQPNLDVKPGTVGRDLFIEAPASQLSLVYDEIGKVSDLQSLRLSIGSNLDGLAQNYGVSRRASIQSNGVGLLTFASIPTSIVVNKNSLIISSNGVSFAILNGVTVNPSFINSYKAVATRYRNELDFLGITDQYAVEVACSATTPGLVGNISKYGLVRTSIPGVSNVTNIFPFAGGSNQEDDTTFRNRILSVFSGSNVGTELGYRNSVIADPAVIDALVIEPGDPLMIRDGTQVKANVDGSFTILSEGQGGKVDIIVLGSRLSQYIDSFIYRDASNRNDPTDIKNIFVLGQITGDQNKTVNRRRIDNLAAKVLPAQPVDSLAEVTGSLSGTNFLPKSIDSLGRVTGNYELVKDTGVFSGSPWSFDKFRWINDRISLFPEDKIKGKFNGQDPTTFPDVLAVPTTQQNVSIQNENASVTNSDRTSVSLLHTPCTNVTRVFNLTTGERYTVTAQNPDGIGTINNTGRISITGNTLPSTSDTLQVDYTWLVDYDPYMDYDGRMLNNNPRSVQDSVDWGLSNAVRREKTLFTRNASSTIFSATTSQPIGALIDTKIYSESAATVTVVAPGSIFAGKNSVTITGQANQVTSIDSIVIVNSEKQVYNTAQNDGSFSNTKVIIGSSITYTCTIILPSDSVAVAGNLVTISFNEQDIYTVNGSSGNFIGNQMTIPFINYLTGPASFSARVSYIANTQNLLTANLSELPIVKRGNGFFKNFFASVQFANPALAIRREFTTMSGAGTSALCKLVLPSAQFKLKDSQVVGVVRISDGYELWSRTNQGVSAIAVDGNYTLTTSGTAAAVNGDFAMAVYFADDSSRAQPMTFDNTVISSKTAAVVIDGGTGKYSLQSLTIPTNVGYNQVSAIRLSDGMELIDSNATINSNSIIFSTAMQSIINSTDKVYLVFYSYKPLRQASTRLAVTLSDQVNNEGTLTISGTTTTKVKKVVFTAINSGLTQNVSEAVRNFLGNNSSQAVSSNLKIVRLVKLEKVSMVGNEVVSVLASYNVLGTKINNAVLFSNEMIEDQTLGNLDFTLPSTSANTNSASGPQLGDKLRITFYYANSSDTESLFFTRNGTVYGNKFFALIDKVYVSSGFNTSLTGKLTISTTNQPIAGSRYRSQYDYLAPKPNERIIITYNYNKLIGDASLTLEPQRPINADVLLKSAVGVLVNASLAIVVKPDFINSSANVLQNVKDKVISAINTNTLSDVLNESNISSIAQSVDGVDRVRITGFNKDQNLGQVLTITAQKNQFFEANNITVVLEGSS